MMRGGESPPLRGHHCHLQSRSPDPSYSLQHGVVRICHLAYSSSVVIAEVHGDMLAEHLMAENRRLLEVMMATYHPSGDYYTMVTLFRVSKLSGGRVYASRETLETLDRSLETE